jgi:hypothetical protein
VLLTLSLLLELLLLKVVVVRRGRVEEVPGCRKEAEAEIEIDDDPQVAAVVVSAVDSDTSC